MRLEIRCFAGLSAATPPGNHLTVPENISAAQVMAQLGLQPAEVKLIIVNGIHADVDTVLHENDRLAFVPAVGGG